MITLSFWFQSHAIWVSMDSPGPFSQNTPFCASSGEPGHCGHQGCVKVSLSLYFETPTVWLSTDWTLAIKICHFELTWDPTDPKQSPHFQKKLLSFDFLIYTACGIHQRELWWPLAIIVLTLSVLVLKINVWKSIGSCCSSLSRASTLCHVAPVQEERCTRIDDGNTDCSS